MFRVMFMTVAVSLLLVGSAFAAGEKIGIFNSQAIAVDSDAAKAAQTRLQGQFGSERVSIEKQAQDLQAKGEALQGQMAALSDKAREEKQIEFLKLRREFEEKSREFARRVDQMEGQMRQSMAEDIYKSAENIAKKRNLDLILDAASGAVMFATPNLDISREVLAEFNRLWKAGGSKFTSPTAPPAAPKK